MFPMPRFTTVLVALIVVAVALVSIAKVAPEWSHTIGLDFWNSDADVPDMRSLAEAGRDIDDRVAAQHKRAGLTADIARDLCEDRITFTEAIDTLCAIAETSRQWVSDLRVSYSSDYLSATATDRDVMVCYLLLKIKAMRILAEKQGDTAQAAFLSARLTRLEEEIRLQMPSLPRIVLGN
jgi:hypothetical protein